VFVTHNVREAALLADRVLVMTAAPGKLLEEQRIHAPRPRQLDDALVSRVVSEIHEILMLEVNKGGGG
jgi:NitT/TauT family transport system ATP-binding protein